MKTYTFNLSWFNWGAFVVGMIGVGAVTHWNLAALFWAWVAALHLTARVKTP